MWWDLLTRYSVLQLQGPGQVPAACSAEKAISILVYTVLFNYHLDVAAFFYFLPWLWFCSLYAWTRLSRIFLHYSWRISGFLLPFFHLSCIPSLFAAPAFLQKHILFLASLNNTMFIIKSGINYNTALLAKHFCDGFPKQFWVWSMQGDNGCSSVLGLWTARLFGYIVLKIQACNNICICPFACSLVSLWLCQGGGISRHAIGACGVPTAMPGCAGGGGTSLVVAQIWAVLQERCTLWH